MSNKRIGCENFGKFYTEGKVRNRREWRGVTDTLYDYSRWLHNWITMAKMVSKPRNIKAMFRYRWMANYLAVPMMVDRQVVIVKELQSVSAAWLDKLTPYLAAPNPATTLVIISRGEVFKSKSFVKALAAAGATVFESKPVKDWQIPKLLGEYIRDRGLRADDKALDMLHDFIGADLSKLYAEVDKLASILDAGAMVTPEAVERYVGVSREFNNYELVEALAAKDAARVFRIADAFASNPKANPLPVTAPTIFTYFADLLIAYYSPDRSDRGVMQTLGLKSDFQLRRIRTGMSHYNPFQVIEAIHAIRVFDAQSKGQGSRTDPYLLFRDLLYHLLTAPGRLPV